MKRPPINLIETHIKEMSGKGKSAYMIVDGEEYYSELHALHLLLNYIKYLEEKLKQGEKQW